MGRAARSSSPSRSGLPNAAAAFETIINRAGPLDDTPRRLYRITLANYFAAAGMMPYQAFHTAAETLSYDVNVLAQRFNAGFEQVCHRLTTLQRPNARGVPFFMLRVDNAGNVSKRFSSGTFPFSKFGGTCPLWNVHSTFDTPDRLLKQVIELPDGTRYFSIAQMVRRPVAPHPQPQPRFAIGLGCEIRHAAKPGLCHRHGPGKNRGHADRRQLPALRTRKLQPARRAADHPHLDPRREHKARVVVCVQQCEGVVRAQLSASRRRPPSSSPRKRGPIRRGACFERRCSTTFAQHQRLWLWVPAFAGTTVWGNSRYSFAFPRRDAPGRVLEFFAQQRAWGMPGACAPAAARVLVVSTRVSHHESRRKHPAFPHANGFTAYFVLSPVIGLSCHRHPWKLASQELDAGVEASGPHDFAVRVCAVRPQHIRVHRIPHPTFVTIAIRPSSGAGRRKI